MNPILTLLGLLFSGSVITHDVESTRLIKDGTYLIATTGIANPQNVVSEVQVKIHYELHTQWYAPIRDQVGDLVQELPVEFTREEGYLELERQGHEEFKNVDLYHLGRVNDAEFKNCHKIRVVKKDNSWEAIAYYHPSIASTGWSHMELTLKKIPVMGDYTLFSELRR